MVILKSLLSADSKMQFQFIPALVFGLCFAQMVSFSSGSAACAGLWIFSEIVK